LDLEEVTESEVKDIQKDSHENSDGTGSIDSGGTTEELDTEDVLILHLNYINKLIRNANSYLKRFKQYKKCNFCQKYVCVSCLYLNMSA